MKHVKKILAFALTLVMALAVALPAFAAPGDLTVDDKVTVSGFEAGDTVTAYKFIEWDTEDGWQLVDEFDGITLDDIEGQDSLTADQLATLAKADNIAKMEAVNGTTEGTTWTLTCGNLTTAGSYLVLVKSSTAKYIYNPVVVSADFDSTSEKAVNLTPEDANLKKQTVSIAKVADNGEDDYSVKVGDVVPFTVTVTVPQYNDNWIDPSFVVTDQLSAGLKIEEPPTVGTLTEDEDYTIEYGKKGDSGFTISFTEDYLKNNASAAIEIKYSAKVGEGVAVEDQVNEETNTVTLQFSNDPTDSSSHKTDEKETHHYTFAIDGKRLGQGTGKTNELIKVGVAEDGTPITTIIEGEEFETGVAALQGATFTLTGENGYVQSATSDADGRLLFKGLEEGTYTLTETSAPNGYIPDPDPHTVTIDATYASDGTLASYHIEIDGDPTTSYTTTTHQDSPTTYEAPSGGNYSFVIDNKQGSALPSTGGIGTTIFYVVGGVMVGAAAIFLLTKRRMASAE